MKNAKKFTIIPAMLIAGGLMLTACSTGSNADPTTASPTGAAAISQGQVLKDGAAATGTLAANAQVAKFDKSIFDQYHGPTDEMTNDSKRDLTLNDPNRVGYVYIMSGYGQLIANYTILGKVSSTTSQLTESQDIVDDNNCVTGVVDGGGSNAGYTKGACSDIVDSLGDDGTYGGEEPGIFFYTTSGVLVEWGSSVIWGYGDAPMGLTSKPVLTYNVNTAVTGDKK